MRAVAEYISFDPCAGDESEIACRTVSLRKARKSHPCFFGLAPYGDGHRISSGETYRYEKALVDRDFWGQYRVCLRCIDRMLDGDYP